MHIKLSEKNFQKAKDYLLEQGRPLEQARFRRIFEKGAQAKGSAKEVIAALQTYQNPDWGFGHALEPDCRAPESSVLAGIQALQRFYSLGTSVEEPMLVQLIHWFRSHLYTTTHGSYWSFLPAKAQHSPHAPWWDQCDKGSLAKRFSGFEVNPRAEIVALLWQWPSLLPKGLLAQLTVETKDAILRGLNANDIYGQRAAAFFAGMPSVPNEERQPVLEYLQDILPARVDVRKQKINPLIVAPLPEHPLVPQLRPEIQIALDRLINSQGSDGSWQPTWSWQDRNPEAWAEALRDWQSIQTMNALATLWAWDRLG